ncbi:MAG: hypothetical protein R8N23_16250 [Reichenbachiella sp.]|uniref:hypothetical protein n=1 Tax=Reichenbachiella sp. TaxID=2184521 RepID=UPI002966A08F|nr:hypothetical protein [Reichenbachiella sp.]MDW3211423.1 hypothetical protein [Reichenbachiella sp.]
MKQVIVLSIKDYESEIQKILKGIEIPIFSKVDIDGCRNAKRGVDLTNWFANSVDSDFSVMYFAFVASDVADQILDAIECWNESKGSQNPMHAFIQPVERIV